MYIINHPFHSIDDINNFFKCIYSKGRLTERQGETWRDICHPLGHPQSVGQGKARSFAQVSQLGRRGPGIGVTFDALPSQVH